MGTNPPRPVPSLMWKDVERNVCGGVWQRQFGVMENAYFYTWLSPCLSPIILLHLSSEGLASQAVEEVLSRLSPNFWALFYFRPRGLSKEWAPFFCLLLTFLSPPPARVYNLFYHLILSTSVWGLPLKSAIFDAILLSRILFPPRATHSSFVFPGYFLGPLSE